MCILLIVRYLNIHKKTYFFLNIFSFLYRTQVNNNVRWYDTRSAMLAGLDGLAGLEYIFYEAPISLGIEVKPYFDVFGRKTFDIQLFDFAFTIKYLF